MNNLIKNIINGVDIESIIEIVVKDIYKNGPDNITNMEILCYLAIYQIDVFNKWKDQILKYMGLTYKEVVTKSLPEVVFGMYEKYIKEVYNQKYTPVQASIVNGIEGNSCFSFSAPTSTGKSYVFRNIINRAEHDVIIVVPSRALINEYYSSLCALIKDKSVNILTFIDKINTKKSNRSVFIVTPERCKELFRQKDEFNVDIFLFDEAQLSNEESSRGIFFDSIIRRAQKAYPKAKFVFAHPFVENPDAQIIKNHFDNNKSNAKCYKYRNVGQLFYAFEDGKYYHFGIDKDIMGRKKYLCRFDPIEDIIKKEGSILIYTTKASIYSKKVFTQFVRYLKMCPEILDKDAQKYIKQIKKYIGANDDKGAERYSQMIDMMKHGIVIHHGSLPLQARLLLEQFTQAGYCRICFATSTLEQGINMPFDIVFLNTFPASKPLSLKNLIGRAGRSTLEKKFDYGSIIVKIGNMRQLREIICKPEVLENISMLEQEDVDQELQEFKEAILEGTISDKYNITEKQLEKLKTVQADKIIRNILNFMFDNEKIVSLKIINEDQECKLEIYGEFEKLYEQYLGRELCDGEKNVLNTAIKILLWQIHCKSFKDICFYRYSYASRKQEREKLKKTIDEGDELDKVLAKIELQHLNASFITGYADIPDKQLKVFSMFGKETKACDVDYDRIVFDTYDYLDKINGFKLSDIYFAAFREYYEITGDSRAERMAQLIKYGTENEKEIWMLRYGFSFEDIEWLEPLVERINQEEVIFNDEVNELLIEKKKIIERFI